MMRALAASFSLTNAAAADSVYIDSPANGALSQSAPADYAGRAVPENFPPPSDYRPEVSGAVQVETSPGVWGGANCTDIPGLCGVYTFKVALSGGIGEDWAASNANPIDVQGSNALPDGAYRLEVGQVSDNSLPTLFADSNFYVDGTSPDSSVISGPPQYNKDSGVTFHFQFGGNDPQVNNYASGVDYFNCKVDSGPWAQCTTPGGSAPYLYDVTVPEGGHTLYVKAVDKAGNEDATAAQYSWIVDETDPVATITRPVNKDRYILHNASNPIYSCTDPVAGNPPAASGIATAAVVYALAFRQGVCLF